MTAQSSTPGDAQFNSLNPRLRILDAAGNQLEVDDNGGADGKNASLASSTCAAGVYYLEVTSTTAVGTAGEYVLRVVGNTVTLPPFQVTTTTPANGAGWEPPTSYTVDFNDAYLVSSVQASDLQVDGVNATGITIVDGDTISFTLPTIVTSGNHTVIIAAGAIVDIQGTPLAAFSGSFSVDLASPLVTATSVAPGVLLRLAR